MKAIWNGHVVAESAETVVVEGNHYFPADSIRTEYFAKSDHTTTCGWKGLASYYDLEIDGEKNANAAWFYADPKDAAKEIKSRVAFWKGVEVVD